ncbi:MAG: histidine kinase, partial [Myxococcota bacterium]
GPRNPLFWLVQAGTWLVLHAALILPLYGIATTNGVSTHGIATDFVLGALAGFGVSSVMAVLYTGLPVRCTEGAAAVGTVVAASFLGAVVWAWLQLQILDFSGAFIFLKPEILDSTYAQPIIRFTRCFVVLGLWSAIFFVILLSYRVRESSLRAMTSAQRANEAQLQLLRAQLNPHFLFNALNSVVALVEADPARAKDMVRNLSSLLRSALCHSDGAPTTVGDELDFVGAYLNCERVRYEDRLQVTISVPESLRSQPLPSMSLQPLVENAIKHGMRGRDPLSLRIEGENEEGQVQIAVVNSRPREGAPAAEGTGMGLSHVRTRIRMMFPDSGEVSLQLGEEWSTAAIRYRLPRAGKGRS